MTNLYTSLQLYDELTTKQTNLLNMMKSEMNKDTSKDLERELAVVSQLIKSLYKYIAFYKTKLG